MDAEFWKQAWFEGRTGFHRSEYHPQLLEFFPLFEAKNEQSILVPLCGKTKDLTWLSHQNLYVQGIELSEKAVREYFSDNSIENYNVEDNTYTHQNLTLEVGDFFHHEKPEGYDYIYDRAAIVALPPSMRVDYSAHCLSLLKPGGKILLITFEYDQSKLDGPPFCVPEKEVNQLYAKEGTIELLNKLSDKPNNPKFKEAGVTTFIQKVYLITKKEA
ncbi:MAG: thiopurine S-methyltransferase [Bacteriovoracaceae bacterium]|nr:thiopurine S-methyltransferase [Bacteriovoracaceae bacterium]